MWATTSRRAHRRIDQGGGAVETGRARKAIAGLAIAAVVLTTAGVAVAATGTWTVNSAGAAYQQLRVQNSNAAFSTASTTYVDLPGSAVTMNTDTGEADFVIARFTAESSCTGSSGGCQLRIMSGNTELTPVSGADFAFDTASTDGAEGHAAERSGLIGNANGCSGLTNSIRVQVRSTSASTTFQLDDWHFTVERYNVDKPSPC